MRIVVTGASGFVGGAVTRALAEHGHDVTGTGRRDDVQFAHAVYRRWALSEKPPEGLFDGVDAVVHAAALADDWAPRSRALATNLGGTRAVLDRLGDARLVHLSTASVYDPAVPTVRAREEEAPVARYLGSYAASKAAAERELMGRMGAKGVRAVILRPHAVYGPGDTTLLPRLLRAARGGVLRLPSGGEVLHTLTHIDNLVHAVRRALDPASPTGVYNVGDDSAVVLGPVLRELLVRRGITGARIESVPYRTAYLAAGAAERLSRLTRLRPPVTRYAVSQLGLERTLELSRARELLDYRPTPTTLDGARDW
ncbi:NAD-dependent epimerase/dehydratase family protein [Galbitalea soli]|uniref:NAD(P)-dependent oxidoreductase n=1 Tax=Galbitalea soli TaxID=1268042 RepID=A0A7C9PME6_9MICO|nr:NAD(P)-dependent oxidoreductase [Galbitalea soli]NYJ31449.1 nucleoside-diphosphate-sugar epimerase [Galbitalea soli]